MIETLLGTVLGGAFRLAPEVLKWMDKDKDRQHELAMFDRQLELDKMRSEAKLDKINAQAATAFKRCRHPGADGGQQGSGSADW